MTIYLYVKTHNITGLKYLGKTAKDPFIYNGSGKYWQRHLRKYGYDITTEILFETTDPSEIKEKGLYYSNLFDVVNSDQWANLKPESGDGGVTSPEIIQKILNTKKANGYVLTEETKSKISASLKGNKRSEESIQKTAGKIRGIKRSTEFKENLSNKRKGELNPYYGKNHSEEVRKRISESHKGKKYNQSKHTCEHCGLVTIKSNIVRWHGDKCKFKNRLEPLGRL